jgi:hypothetical protein
MTSNLLSSVATLADRDLLTAVEQAVASERESTARLIAHLVEIDARRLYAAEACESMFLFCVERLHMGEHAAYHRIAAARAARVFPIILDLLADGSVHVTTVRLLAPHLTEQNHRELLDAARHKTRREVERMVAALAPQPPVPAVIRKLSPKPAAPSALTSYLALPVLAPPAASPRVPVPASPARPAIVAPLSAATFKLQCTVGEKTYERLRLAQDMLRHQVPSGDLAQVVDRALTALLVELTKQKFAATDHPRPGRQAAEGSRHIPAEVKRAVWLRDMGRCTFVSESGKRCGATGFIEFHHVKPYASGGEATVSNLRLLCRVHNAHEAALVFGPPRIREEPAVYADANSARAESRNGSDPVRRLTLKL